MFEALFQTFEEPESGVALTARLSAFREELARRKLTGFVIPRADQQQNEYVAPSEERLAWLTGFTGSAGLAIVLTHNIWTADWRVLITIFGWLNVIGGAVRLVGPPLLVKVGRAMLKQSWFIPIAAAIWVVLGSLFCLFGFLR